MSQGLYIGKVHHARFGPKRHRLSYRIFMVLVEVADDPPVTGLARNRPGLISVWDKDHGDGSPTPLRAQVEALVQAHGRPRPEGRIEMLCMPRVLGRAFNPLTLYYAHDRDGRLETVVYEVSNTFGGRHWYVLAADRQRCGKAFFVSPFMDQDLAYDFEVAAPDERAFVGIRVSRGGEAVLTASFSGQRRALTRANLLLAWLAHPLQTIGVLAGIYLEGLKLLLKGFRWRSPRSTEAQGRLKAV